MALEQLKLVVDAVDNASGVLGGIGSALGRVGDIVGTAVVGAFAAGGAAVAAALELTGGDLPHGIISQGEALHLRRLRSERSR
jgi:hypothetical protein